MLTSRWSTARSRLVVRAGLRITATARSDHKGGGGTKTAPAGLLPGVRRSELGGAPALLHLVADELVHPGQDGDEDDGQNDDGEVLLHEGEVAEEVAAEEADRDPEDPAHHV